MTDSVETAANLLVEAARTMRPLADLPADLQPRSAQEAYAIQDAVAARTGPVAGWKVTVAREGAPSTCAPIVARESYPSGSRLPVGLAQSVEAELAFRFMSDLPGKPQYTREDIAAVIGTAEIAIEIVGSRYVDRLAVAPLCVLADAQSTSGFVTNATGPSWRDVDWPSVTFALTRDGESVGEAGLTVGIEGYLETLAWLAAHVSARGHAIKAGQVVITGARIGPVPLAIGASFTATSPQLGEVSVAFAG